MKNAFDLIRDIIFSLFLAFAGMVVMVIFWKLMDFDLFAYPVFLIASYLIFRRIRLYKKLDSPIKNNCDLT